MVANSRDLPPGHLMMGFSGVTSRRESPGPAHLLAAGPAPRIVPYLPETQSKDGSSPCIAVHGRCKGKTCSRQETVAAPGSPPYPLKLGHLV